MKKIEKVIFPMNTIKISQGQLYDGQNASHQNRHAWDLVGQFSSDKINYEEAYAPCTCKLIRFPKENEFNEDRKTNTAYFGTCDEDGNPTEVMCADGQMRILTFALTHCDDFNRDVIKDKIYLPGELFYKEGGRGEDKDTGKKGDGTFATHIHIEVAEDWHPEGKANREVYVDGIPYTTWQMENTLDLQKIFFRLPNQKYIHNDIKEGITIDNFPLTQSRYVEESELRYKISKEKYKNVDIAYVVLNNTLYDLKLKHAFGYNDFLGNSLKNYCSSDDNDLVAINGGPFIQKNGKYLNILGVLKLKRENPIGNNDLNPKIGFKNGRLIEISYPISNQAELARYDWIRSCNKFVLIKNAQSVHTNTDNPEFYSTVAHSAIGQCKNGDYILFCSEPGLTLKDITTFLLEKGCIVAFNLGDGNKSALVIKKEYIIKNSSNDVDLLDAIIVTNKQHHNDFGKLKMRIINSPITVRYSTEKLTIPVEEIVEVNYLGIPYEGLQTGNLIYQGKEYYFEYNQNNMVLFGNILNQRYFIHFYSKSEEGVENVSINGIEIFTNKIVKVPLDVDIKIIEVVKRNDEIFVVGVLDDKLIEIKYEHTKSYISNHFETSGIG
ncbi:MAG: phosphodiester glycosidase family protein [Erysipelotrichaceae bacterium]|nr:phosphodiester glycosidase family protein [Erysipelotrichaceae bacterium]